MKAQTYHGWVAAARLLLGTEFLVNGLNWWVKMITPYPSISDGASLPKGDVVAAMIDTHLLFHIVKATEVAAGVALLGNWFVPLALVMVFPVTVNVFLVDAFVHHRLRAFIMGSGAMLLNSFLMLAYLDHYRGMLVLRSRPDEPNQARHTALDRLRSMLGPPAALVGVVMVTWVAVMIVQHFS